MAGDWIKLHRKMLDSPIMKHAGLFQLWGYCLLKANWKETRWFLPGTTHEITVPRGSFVTGQNSLHSSLYPICDESGVKIKRDWTPTPRTVWNWLMSLERMKCVTLANVSNRCTLVSVVNYAVYQDVPEPGKPSVSNCFPTAFQLLSTEEEEKERKNDGHDRKLPTPDEFMRDWNEAVPFAPITVMPPGRKQTFRWRCQDPEWLGNYRKALSRIASCPFLRGEGKNGWKITPDFFLKEDTVARILDGCFDEIQTARQKPTPDDEVASIMRERAERKRREEAQLRGEAP